MSKAQYKMSFEETKKLAEKIDGWLRDKEGKFLYKTAKNCSGKGVIVEIGSWKGRSTVYLAKGSKAGSNVKIYAIDPHITDHEHKIYYGSKSTFQEFKRNIEEAEIDDITEPLMKTSEEAAKNWDKPIEFLWIDGDHSYKMAKLDFDLWSPYLIDGGVIAFHDSTFGDVKRVVKEVFKSKQFQNLNFIESITFATKTKDGKSALQNYYILFLIDLIDFIRNLPVPGKIRNLLKKLV